ncbi:MAG: thioredoxin [Bacteroidales bacterium]|nr:thioredoxin [Bacteroidales bacterium]
MERGNFNTIIQDHRPVVIDFHAQWCGPCRVQSPILKEVASELGEQIRVIKIDVDQNPELAVRYGIQGVPTLMVFKNGEIKYKQSGVHQKSQLISVINQAKV